MELKSTVPSAGGESSDAILIKGGAYKNYLLGLLLLILTSNYVDRVALGLLLQDIKVDLRLSDTQLGLLTGIAFAMFYAVMGIPIARWADRGNRVTIISLTAALWSVMVGISGVTTSFAQLLLVRIGVAVGEAGCIPPAQSLISDYFSRAQRPRALAIYMLGAPLSYGIGYFLAGRFNEVFGWRVTFMLLGIPGLALAALAWFTLNEPRSGKPVALPSDASAFSPVAPSLKVVFVTLGGNSTFRHLLVCFAAASFFGYGAWQWKPAFFIRSYGLGTVEVGTWFAIIYGVFGILGMYLGGELASRRAGNNERLQLEAIAVAYSAFAAISACMYLSPNAPLAFGLMALGSLGYYVTIGPLFATVQTLVQPRMRAIALATLYLVGNLVGLGLGPLTVGVLSDYLRPSVGEESLRYALLALSPGYLWAAWHSWRASKTIAVDLGARTAEQRIGS